jgi:hypothetical protein
VGGLSEVNSARSSEGSSSRRNECCRSSASRDNGVPASSWVDMIAAFFVSKASDLYTTMRCVFLADRRSLRINRVRGPTRAPVFLVKRYICKSSPLELAHGKAG